MKFLKSKLFVAIFVLIVIGAIWLAHRSGLQTSEKSEASSAPTAGVMKVTREDLFKQVTISAEFRPFQEVALHAKVSGYVKSINVDFGDKVKAGDLLATLEVPELKDQMDSALAAAQKAEADFTNANLIYSRLVSVNKDHPNLVAQQELDTASASTQTAAAALASAKAEIEKYQTLIGYTKITAPFDGVVTHRYADLGELIQSGTASDTQARPVVRVSDNYRLRLDFPVSVDLVQEIQVGDAVDVKVDSLNGKMLTGKISRSTGEVDDKTRTMITEVEVENPDLTLLPGMYATVILKFEKRPAALAVPTEAVAGEKSPLIFVVNADNQIEERAVKLGLETPDKIEVLSGLREGELVVVGNRSEFKSGQKVEPKLLPLSRRE